MRGELVAVSGDDSRLAGRASSVAGLAFLAKLWQNSATIYKFLFNPLSPAEFSLGACLAQWIEAFVLSSALDFGEAACVMSSRESLLSS